MQKHHPQRRHGLEVSQLGRFSHVLQSLAGIWGYRNPVELQQPQKVERIYRWGVAGTGGGCVVLL